MKRLIIIGTVILFAGLLYQPGQSTGHHQNSNKFILPSQQIHTGDIVLRNGKGFISDIFRNCSQTDPQYSHAGVAEVTSNGIYVYHILGSEVGHHSGLKKEKLNDFCNSKINSSYAVYRYPFLSGKQILIKQYLEQVTNQKIKFDEGFDLNSDSTLYCTEMIYNMCREIASTTLPVTVFRNNRFVAPDNLYINNFSILITKKSFQADLLHFPFF